VTNRQRRAKQNILPSAEVIISHDYHTLTCKLQVHQITTFISQNCSWRFGNDFRGQQKRLPKSRQQFN